MNMSPRWAAHDDGDQGDGQTRGNRSPIPAEAIVQRELDRPERLIIARLVGRAHEMRVKKLALARRSGNRRTH
jgi:hypothetical protein